MEYFKDKEVHNAEKNMNEAIVREFQAQEQLEKKKKELRGWQNAFDRRVEEVARKRIQSWTPSVEDADEAFRQAERMALHRETMDAGLKHPPRSDAGEPVILSRIKFRR